MGVEPINVRTLGIDVFTSGCQKWMLSPQGCGFFYVSDRVNDSIVPPFMSWLGVDWKMQFSDLFHFDRPFFDDARRLDMGYFVDLNMAGMLAANNFFKELGIANIRQHNYELLDYLSAYLESNPAYTITSSRQRLHRSSIMTFTCEGYRELFTRLTARKIVQVPREGSIRVAIHLFNNRADVDKLIEELERFAKSSR
jgi:selenocysteine lyase/cysteine desulfurase